MFNHTQVSIYVGLPSNATANFVLAMPATQAVANSQEIAECLLPSYAM